LNPDKSETVSQVGYDMIKEKTGLLLYLYRARNKITQLSVPTHAQLQRHRLKFIKNHLKNLLRVSVPEDGRRPKHVGVF